jgi:hypothetical protein
MKTLIDNREIFYDQDIRLIINLKKRDYEKEYPEKFKWALQMLHLHEGYWTEICRIDNYPHEGQIRSHIHVRGQRVLDLQVSFKEAKQIIKDISRNILREKYNRVWNNEN